MRNKNYTYRLIDIISKLVNL